jgi:hypothetical protein
MFGTYPHGPVLARNPALADLLLGQALERRGRRLGPLQPLGQDWAGDLHLARLQAVLSRRGWLGLGRRSRAWPVARQPHQTQADIAA